ncbi:MAG: AMP-binding protein [Methanoregula sp.]|jgi:acyl-CoA synthetase (AMP-forming)/AMP-acid ligase II|nr:AMP-binding protein [Methanoregula sp.]
MFVHEFLKNSAKKYPEKTALIWGDQQLTYQELDAMAGRCASALREQGIQKGDRVVIVNPNSVETIAALFGVLKAGGVFLVVHHSIKEKKLTYILKDSGARAIVLFRNQVPSFENVLNTGGLLSCMIVCGEEDGEQPAGQIPALSWSDVQKNYSPLATSPPLSEQDLACLVYTSGSTGEPKGVMETHACIDFATGSIIQYLENTADDIVLNCLPLSFDYGLYQPLMVFKFGGTLVLERSFMFPAAILKKMEKELVTGFPGVPTIFSLLLQMDLSPYDLSSLRYITNTAAALPVSHIERLSAKFPQARLYSMYGQTECKRVLYLPPHELKKRPGSVGIAIPGTEVWIQGPGGERLPPGSTGQLVVRGRHVMKGYLNKARETASTFGPGRFPEEGVLFTGDLFRQDDEGFFYFISRVDDIIKTRGEKVAPKEVENVLYLLPSILEAAVVGIPDELEGEAIKAYLVSSDPDLSVKDVINHCKKHLESFMIPKYVEFRDTLPKGSTGKIARRDIV